MLFKKPIVFGSKNLLGNKDRKKLRNSILKKFSHTSKEDDIDLIFKESEIYVIKVQGLKTLIYFIGGEPFFFDLDGTGDIYPTLYVLSILPNLIPNFLIHEEVSSFILGGADLMAPGIISPNRIEYYGPEGLLIKKVMGIRVKGNPFPFAVGRCTITNNGFTTGKGKALEVLHVYHDTLWNLGSRKEPNSGFQLKRILASDPPIKEDPYWYNEISLNKNTNNNQQIIFHNKNDDDDDDDDGWGIPSSSSSLSLHEKNVDFSPHVDLENNQKCLNENIEEIIKDDNHRHLNPDVRNNISKEEEEEEEEENNDKQKEEQDKSNDNNTSNSNQIIIINDEDNKQHDPINKTKLTPPFMDLFLELCLLEVLHNHLSDSSCPISISAIFSKMTQCANIIQFHPKLRSVLCQDESDIIRKITDDIANGSVLVLCDVKESSYKKLSKFFQSCSKKKLLITKEVRGEIFVVTVKRDCPIYINYVPTTEKDRKNALNILAFHSKPNVIETPIASSSSKPHHTKHFKILDFYKPNSRSQFVFENIVPEIENHYYTPQQCKSALTNYINHHNLTISSTPHKVKLDIVLQQSILNKEARKQPKEDNLIIEKAELFQKFIESLQAYHAVVKDTIPNEKGMMMIIRHGRLKPIQLKIEKRQGRKAVTIITNIQSFEVDEKALAEILQRTLASSATTFEITGAAKGKTKPLGVMVQGNFLEEVTDVLITQYGIPRNFITIV